MADKNNKKYSAKPNANKKFNGLQYFSNQEQTYLQKRITALLPTLMAMVTQSQDGMFVFVHPTFPDLRVEGLTIGFVQEHVERAIKRHFRGQSDKHIDYLFNLLSK